METLANLKTTDQTRMEPKNWSLQILREREIDKEREVERERERNSEFERKVCERERERERVAINGSPGGRLPLLPNQERRGDLAAREEEHRESSEPRGEPVTLEEPGTHDPLNIPR